ncbi:MAG TPA: rod shape-determining protein MreC [Candidatus Paceibacterota bacterium]|nr:rod shape-determining protein MreC [Candidatus Paceibacterota bacterium]
MRKYGRSRQVRPATVILAAVLLLVTIFFRPLSRGVKTIATPLWQTRQAANEFTNRLLQSKKSLAAELASVEAELTESRLKIIELSTIEEENKELRKLLGRGEPGEVVLAGILTHPQQSLYNTFQIDAGTGEGIVVGARVFVGTSMLVGTITDVTARGATVTPFASPGNQTSAYVEGSNVSVTITGRGGGDFEVELPRDIPFDPGMAIVSQGIHSYIIAIIEHVISDPRDPFQKLLARMPVNLRTVKWVTVEKK